MDLIAEGISKAFWLLVKGDRDVLRIALLTLKVSGSATLISLALGVPLGTALALGRFPGRNAVASLINTGMGLPPVVVGLWVSIMLWRYGPLGSLRLLYTPTAMVIAQTLIALPIITGLTMSGVGALDPGIRVQLLSMGATRWQIVWLLVREARLAILAAVIAGFGRAVSEIGASMMVGGNVVGETRVLTTATSMEVSRGNFGTAIALSILLLLITLSITAWLTHVQQKGRSTSL
ncbi:MAG: Sulfate transport system permease protein CysW [Firmicutes bacterium ADurb.Bin506]|nr:MAG: Sulfate transport system permease protein CysW [Firmicutes bacterium ADurb.Bin506]